MIDAYVENGVIQFNNGIPEVPATSETEGIVTITNAGRPGTPASFEVTFKIVSEFDVDGIGCNPYISMMIPVAVTDKGLPFVEVEERAAEHIGPILRALAEKIEAQVLASKSETDE